MGLFLRGRPAPVTEEGQELQPMAWFSLGALGHMSGILQRPDLSTVAV